MKHYDLTNQRFGRLTAVSPVGKTRGGTMLWECVCDCGEKHIARSGGLRSGDVMSCGCLRRETTAKKSTVHGLRHTKLYRVWRGMKERCLNENDKSFHNYGGRGIKICDEWLHDFQAFYDWAMANGYADGLSIDRIDNDWNYCPENCRWATRDEQNNNKRVSRMVTVNDETHTIGEWAKLTGINYHTLYCRAYRDEMRYERLISLIQSVEWGQRNEAL